MKKQNIFTKLFILVFIVFLGMYIYSKTEYYEKAAYNKRTLTENQMKVFEEDIKNGKAVDINKYIPQKKDYSNFVSRGAYKFSVFLSDILTDKCHDVIKVVKTLFID